jgi:hypothetical protein
MDFCGFWVVSVKSLKFGGDDDAAELGGHVGGGRLGLRGVPGCVQATGLGVASSIATSMDHLAAYFSITAPMSGSFSVVIRARSKLVFDLSRMRMTVTAAASGYYPQARSQL